MALSWSGETVELKNLIDYSRRFRIGLIAVTSDGASTLAQAADVTLVLPQAREACPHNLAPDDLLADAARAWATPWRSPYWKAAASRRSIFASCIRAGGLGAALTFTRDLMHAGDTMPLVTLGRRMSNAIMEMSTKGFGCVGIIDADGQLVGIVTDGDLRRHMRPDLLDLPVENVMTRAPDLRQAGSARERDAAIAECLQDHRRVRHRTGQAGRRHPSARSVARRGGVGRAPAQELGWRDCSRGSRVSDQWIA